MKTVSQVKRDKTRDNQVNYKKDELNIMINSKVNIPANFF